MNQTDFQNELKRLELRAEKAEQAFARLEKVNETLLEKLDEANERAESAERMKSRFLSNISHEVRTPMNGILGMTELLLCTELNDQQKNFTQSISRSTESLLCIINDMLDFSGLQQGQLELEDNLFFFSKIIRDVCNQFEDKAAEKSIKLICNTKTSLQTAVVGDEFRIRQIISNLIDNAIKYTDSGEVIVTELNDTEDGTHSVSVQDTGNGISSDIQSRIFRSFSQADNSSTRKFGGTGLGLTIASALAKLMNGDIAMQSCVGSGTTFTFRCELEDGDTSTINQIGKSTLSGIKVLVVDDTATNREILQLQLGQWDLDVHCAESGTEALGKLQSASADNAPYKLAILDLNMPNMDGLELAHHIQQEEYAKDLRLMMLTSSVTPLNQKALQERGILKSMMKPARQALLYEAITKIMAHDENYDASQNIASDKATRILLTEADPINQEVATTMLESMGYEVVIADNGAMAVDALLQDNDFDVVLMDCQMPVMDGFNATRAIRDNNKNIPIIALTANATQGDRDLCIDAGMNDYLTKPIYRTDLSRMVQQWAAKSSNKLTTKEVPATKQTPDEKNMNIEIDESALNAIKSLQRPGKPDILARIVGMYMEKSPELITAIQEGVAANDCDKVKMAAHTLKSSSAYVGATALAEVCGRVEAKAANDQLGDTADDITMINDGFGSVVSQIKQYG